MAGYRVSQVAFIAGEVDPLLGARIDSEPYRYGLETCENFVPVNEGPLVKRPGFEMIGDADDSATWLGAFRYSITQEYVIEWGEEKARFYTNGAQIVVEGTGEPYEVATPYPADAVSTLSIQQSYDRLYIDHPDYWPGSLVRSDAVTFVHETSVLSNGPFLDENTDENQTVTVAGTLTLGGVVTITASDDLFEAGDVGGLFRIEAKDFSDIKAWDTGVANISIGEIMRSDGKAYQALTAGTTGAIVPTHDEGAEWDGSQKGKPDGYADQYGVKWNYLYDRYGIVEITGFTSATEVTGTVKRRLPGGLTSVASYHWAFGAFSPKRGYPSIVLHWNGRQIHLKEFDIYASVAGDFGAGKVNFQTLDSSGVTAVDLGFRRTLATEDPVLWATADRKLLIGTASRELMVGQLNTQEALSGENIQSEVQSFYGSEQVTPLQIGISTIFVERGGRRLRAAGYDLATDRYVPNDLTAAARSVTKGGILQMAYQRIPYGLAYALRGDGQLVVHPDSRGEVKGFARTVLGGGAQAKSIVSVVGEDGKTDELWALIERTGGDGEVRKEIWRQMPWRELGDDQAESFYVDGGTRFEATAGQTDFTGATPWAGQTIVALAGGAVIHNIAVASDGSFSLPAAQVPDEAYTLIAGHPYTATATLLRPSVTTDAGPSIGLRFRIVKVMFRVLEAFALKGGQLGRLLENLILRPADTPMGQPAALQSGDFGAQVDGSITRDGRLQLVSEDPLPAIVNAALMRIEMDGSDV
ncbi:hypothetical protein HT136_01425 [Novosphingobium profundi]|uniref:hypothetical protein n=1 Tax=Novosphingobium profundi TaxID=1774954 RepID=UPI001BDB6BE5|nr:hypothetical protein [Novosphingobium profundi]MBT0667027.1 hypothetical protein [Novosphingobium profundi]